MYIPSSCRTLPLNVYIHLHIYINMYILIQMILHIFLCNYTYICMYIPSSCRTLPPTRQQCMYICIYVQYVCMYMNTHMNMYIYMYMNTYTYNCTLLFVYKEYTYLRAVEHYHPTVCTLNRIHTYVQIFV
jgi:hypothetical protein